MVKTLLQPIVTAGLICYDFHDLCVTLRNSRVFTTLIASFIGQPHHGLIKAGIGTVVGAILLDNRLSDTLKEFYEIIDDISDEILGN